MARGLRGVKDDLSEIGRHLLDIACFFTPHIATTYADSPPSSPRHTNPRSSPKKIGDLSEIGGGFRRGISRLSSVFRRYGAGKESDSSDEGGLSEVREEVLGFVRDLVKCPESWLEFPVPVDDNFDMSSDQKRHIATVERLVPSLAALRLSLCPNFMNEDSFWKIYFALLHPKLNKHESELLSTLQTVEEMRTNLKKLLQDRLNSHSQVPVAESSSSMMSISKESEIQPADDEVHAPAPSGAEQAPLQYIDHWFKRPQSSNKDESETEDDNIVLVNKYKSSSSMEAASPDNSPFSSYERLQLLGTKMCTEGYSSMPLHRRQNRGAAAADVLEDSSDFEIADRSLSGQIDHPSFVY